SGGIFRFKGTINKKYPITMDLDVSPYGEMYGIYYYDNVGKEIQLDGEFNEFGGFTLEERVDGEITGTFSGTHFNPQKLRGTWESLDGNKYYSFEVVEETSTNPLWSGDYHRENDFYYGGDLLIGRETATSFDFSLEVWNSCHGGFAEGKAIIKGDTAFYEESLYDEDAPCQITFIKTRQGLELEGGSSFNCEFGMRATADGTYLPGPAPEEVHDFIPYLQSVQLDVPAEQVNAEIREILDDESMFSNAAYLVQPGLSYDDCENLDDFEATNYCIFVPGCGEELVFLVRPNGLFYLLFPLSGDYFTNDTKFASNWSSDLVGQALQEALKTLPKTFQDYLDGY
ncbi:MAG: hypothetical protein AAFV80_22725, partial [Bacteroidota bacterium]